MSAKAFWVNGPGRRTKSQSKLERSDKSRSQVDLLLTPVLLDSVCFVINGKSSFAFYGQSNGSPVPDKCRVAK